MTRHVFVQGRILIKLEIILALRCMWQMRNYCRLHPAAQQSRSDVTMGFVGVLLVASDESLPALGASVEESAWFVATCAGFVGLAAVAFLAAAASSSAFLAAVASSSAFLAAVASSSACLAAAASTSSAATASASSCAFLA